METSLFKRQVRILHLEDNERDHFLVEELLRANGLHCDFIVAKSQQEFVDALKSPPYDLIISDFTLPSYDGVSALSLARSEQPQTPFIFFSGTIGEEIAVDSLKNGATDYVLKQRPHRLVAAVHRALRYAAERERFLNAEQKIQEQVELLDKAQDAIIVVDLAGCITYWNKSAERIYGWNAEEVIGKNLVELIFGKGGSPELEQVVSQTERQGEWTGEMQEYTRDRRPIIVQRRCTLIRDKDGKPKARLIINTDITERKHLEEQFLRAQRLESLGVLVTGIAHDLNNTLSPILIGINILRANALPGGMESILNTMESSAKRSAEMVKQVLTFARGGDSIKTIIHPEELLREMRKIVESTFPKNIHCEIQMPEHPWTVVGWPTQLHQILMNLCVNARDAMQDGGTLTMTLENIHLDANAAAIHENAKAGDYLCTTIADTGTGIPPEQLKKIFQPFYTTKAPGKGTGLGLSTAMTIIKNHGGFVVIDSVPGNGTAFKFFLPAVIGSASQIPADEPKLPVGNGETILVVDDEKAVRALIRAALENYGYRVITTSGGPEAVVSIAENPDLIQLVITDLDMPYMDGFATMAALRKISPAMKVIIASGSEQLRRQKAGNTVKPDAFLHKPFTTENLLHAVHHVLKTKKNLQAEPTSTLR